MNIISKLKSLPVAAAAVALLAAGAAPVGTPIFGSEAAVAQQQAPKKKQKTRKVPAMSVKVHKQIQNAQEAMDEKNIAEAKEILAELQASTKINDYERAVSWQMSAMIAFDEDDTPGTISAYEQILRYRESIPEALEMNILFGLGQLWYSLENYEKALNYVNQWEERTTIISVNQLIFIAQLHYIREDYRNALQYVYRAISDAEAVDTVEVKESWYGLALSAHWELNEFVKVRDILEILIINWPKPLYWTQLAGIYGELGQEETSYSITEAAYKQGFLDDNDIQLVNMAQIQIARQAPIKAVWVLEKAFKEERIEADGDNRKLLGQAYMMANEFEKAVGPLSDAAGKQSDADLWFQIAQVLMNLDRHADAVDAFDKALTGFNKIKGKERTKKVVSKILNCHMQKGTAYTELQKFDSAAKAFTAASRLAKSKREKNSVKQWRNYMKAEKAREDMLRGTGS